MEMELFPKCRLFENKVLKYRKAASRIKEGKKLVLLNTIKELILEESFD